MNFPESMGSLDRSEHEWYRFVFNSLPIGIVTVDHQRRITYLNPHASELLGWSEEEAKGRFCGKVLRGGQCDGQCPLQTVLSLGKSAVNLRSTLTNREGRTIPVHFRTAGMFRQSGELVGAVEAFHDISERVALEEERERTLSFFAHDMKSPLVSALGIMNRLMAGRAGELNPKQRSYLDIVASDLNNVQSLVTDYLDVIRLGTSQVSLIQGPIHLADTLAEIAQPYRQRAKDKGLEWAFQVPDDLPVINGDVRRLGRVFSNLLDNAVKFSSQGKVELICRGDNRQQVRVLVCDQGPGLSDKDLASLFSPFFRGSAGAKAEGTGLGLAAVKAIVEAHDGNIFVSNREGGGACFEVVLPAAEPA